MDINRKEFSIIKEVLKESPRGMTVTEISRSVKMNRHSVAKYLEVLVAAGHVDMKSFGPSKVYYLSQRVPLSAMLSLSSDLIVILDKDLRIRNMNDKFLEYIGLRREEILNKNIENFAYPMLTSPPLLPGIKDALNGKEGTVDTYYSSEKREYFFVVKFIPTVFEDGGKGVTIIASDYTEHKQIEKMVRESERKFRDMLEQSTDGIIMSDEQGVIIEYNKGLEQLTGYSKSDVIGKHVWEIPFFINAYKQIPDKPHKRLKDYTNTFLKTGESPLTDRFNVYDIEKPDGTVRTIQANIFLIKTDKGYMLCAIARDITSMKNAEMAIRDSEEKFRSVIEQSMDGIALADEQGIIIEFNKQLENITGLKKKEMLGRPAWEVYNLAVSKMGNGSPGSLAELEKQIMPNAFADAEKKFFEVEIERQNKVRRILQALAFRINMEKGSMICAIVRDVTEQKQAEEALLMERGELEAHVKERTIELEKANKTLKAEIDRRISSENALRESEEKYRNLTENVNDVAWEKNKEGKFTYMSPKISDLLGYEPADFIGKTVMDFMPPADADAIREAYWQMFREPMTYSLHETRVLHKDGHEVITEANGIPWYDEQGHFQGYRGVTRDITKRKRMEEMLELMKYSIDRSEDAAFWVKPDAGFYYVNDAASRMLGYSREELLAKSIKEIDTRYNEEKWNEHWGMLKRQKYHKMESVYRTMEGGRFLAEVTENYLEFNGKEYDFAFVRPISPPRHTSASSSTAKDKK